VLDPQALIGSHHLAACSPVHSLDVGFHHKVRHIVITRYLLGADVAFFNHVADPSEECLEMFGPRVVLRVIRRLLCGCSINQDSGGNVFVDLEPGQWE
jgi:hypothetical protein